MTKKLVVVLGMHRSGTSAITRGLQALGVDLGESFIPNYDDNIKGFWEDADFQSINVEMLSTLGVTWDSLSLFTDSNLPEKLSGFRLRALNLLKQKTNTTKVLGLKDPRFSRLMPFWRELCNSEGIDVSYLIALRNPISVALSLQKRNNFDFEKSFYLWHQHMLLSALAVGSENAVVVDFDRMFGEPGFQLSRISDALVLATPTEMLVQEYSDDYLDPTLRHAQYTLTDLENEPAVPTCVLEAFRIFTQLANDEKQVGDEQVQTFFAQQWQALSQSDGLFRLADRQESLIRMGVERQKELEQTVVSHSKDIKNQTQVLQQLRDNIERQKEQLATHSGNHKQIVAGHKLALEEQKSRLITQNKNHIRVIEEHKKRFAEQNEHHVRVIEEHKKQLLELTEQKTWQDKQMSSQNRLLDSRRREIDGLRKVLREKNSTVQQREARLKTLEKQSADLSMKLKKAKANDEKVAPSAKDKASHPNPKLRLFQGLNYLASMPKSFAKVDKEARPKQTIEDMILESGLFDEQWYREYLPANQRSDPHLLQHYLTTGWKEGHLPSLLFDGNWYLHAYPDVKAADICPLQHYLAYGWQENRQPHPDFDGEWYLRFYDDVGLAKIPPLQHYKHHGAGEGRKPNQFFDVRWYVDRYSDKTLSQPINNVLEHYLRANQNTAYACDQHPFFKAKDYVAQNPDFDIQKNSVFSHFLAKKQVYLKKITERSAFDEGITKSFNTKAAAEFCQLIRRNELLASNLLPLPLVSIVMPTHNRRDKIFTAIESVIQQSYENWELLIVDDGSEDDTYSAVRNKYQDERIHIERTEALGVCHARNVALAAARGELIAYLDSDNSWVLDFLELMVAYLQQENADFSYTAIRMENESGTSYRYRAFEYEDLLVKNYIDLNAILHKRWLYEQRKGFDESLSRMVDWDLIIRYAKDVGVSAAPFVGVNYDNHKQPDRITVKEPKSWRYAIMNKHLIDWQAMALAEERRDGALVSIVIPVYGQLELTRKCVFSLLYTPAGCDFEIILVDNGSDHQVLAELFLWSEGRTEIKLVRNLENLNFALGCNLGFAEAKGDTVVFLNNDTEVTPGWLKALVAPLEQKEIAAVQPKLLYPDGRIQCAGIVFSEHSPIGFPIYADFLANLPHLQKSRSYQAVTAACVAVKSQDFINLRGFDPLYVNGQEDVDFCLRLAELGKTCWYEANSVVLHHESRTPGRGQYIAQNRMLFAERWGDRIKPDALKYFQEDGFKVRGWRADKQEIAAKQPTLSVVNQQACSVKIFTFAIKVPCPHAGIKNEWGDYHFARSLGAALRRAGHAFRIDFLNEWEDGTEASDEINIVLRGLSAFTPRKNQVNLMWMISHPEKVTLDELAQYNHVFVASESYAQQLQIELGDTVSCLLQCTDPTLFYPDEKDVNFASHVLFVGNSRNQYRSVVKAAVEANLELAVYGTRWQQFIPKDYLRGENIPNHELANHYRNAGVVLNDHWPDMRTKGFVSNRVFDVLACGVPLVSDNVSGIPPEFQPFVTFYDQPDDLVSAVRLVGQEKYAQQLKRFELALQIHQNHSFDARVVSILSKLARA